MAKFDASDLVHLATNGRWIVAQKDGARFIVHQRSGGTVSGPLPYVQGSAYSYARRADALRRARQMYAN